MSRVLGKKCLLGLFVYSLVSCSTIQIDVPNHEKQQENLSRVIEGRIQILSAELYRNVISLQLKDNVINLDATTIPFIHTNTKGEWFINGKGTGCDVKKNGGGAFLFPGLTVSNNGSLLIDGKSSGYSFNLAVVESLSSLPKDVLAISRLDSYLCFYMKDETKAVVPIAEKEEYIIPDYFFDIVVEKEKQAEVQMNNLPSGASLGYVFFTDAHWERNQKHSPAIIKHITDYSPINQVLFGGDANTNCTSTPEETIDILSQFHDAFSFLGPKLYCLFGNHDDNSTNQVSFPERHLSEEQVYAYLQSQMTNVHYWGYYNFYFDDFGSKTRFICLDTGRFCEPSLRGATVNTARFLIDCLSRVPTGWHIVAASHIWADLIDFSTGETKESSFVKPIIAILEQYNMRANSSFTYNGETLYYDYTNAGATVEYCIGGHTHGDAEITSSNGLPLIIVTCDGQQGVAGGAPYQTGTVNEQCVTIVVNDYQNRQVNIYHIGRGDDAKVKMWDPFFNN